MAKIPKDPSGKPADADGRIVALPHMSRFYTLAVTNSEYDATPAEFVKAGVEYEIDAARHSYMLGYGLFALISSNTNDIETIEREVFHHRERKAAKKNGKKAILNAPETQTTICLGEPGIRYINQVVEDERERRTGVSSRSETVRHPVREHTRRYRSGKVVTVRAHERGSKPDTRTVNVTALPVDLEPDEPSM